MASGLPYSQPPKTWFGLRRWVWLLLLVCGLFVILIFLGSQVTVVEGPLSYEKELRPFTTELTGVDRVEIDAVIPQFETIKKVVGTKTLTGLDASNFQELWRSQSFVYDVHSMCHEPGYRMRFYSHDNLLTVTTICFNCEDIYFYKKSSDQEQYDTNFKATSPAGRKLRSYLSSLFPGHDPDADKASNL